MSVFQPETQQIEICILQTDLQEIGKALVVQRSKIPELDAENDQKHRETMSALHIARSLNAEIDKLNLENVTKSATRLQLKKQCEDLTGNLEQVRSARSQLANFVKQEENDIEILIQKYEESLKEKAEKFRETKIYYNEKETMAHVNEVSKSITDFEDMLQIQRNIVEGLKKQLEDICSNLPTNLLSICGEPQLEKKIKELTEKFDALMQEKKTLQVNQ